MPQNLEARESSATPFQEVINRLDGIKSSGTLSPSVKETMGQVLIKAINRLKSYEKKWKAPKRFDDNWISMYENRVPLIRRRDSTGFFATNTKLDRELLIDEILLQLGTNRYAYESQFGRKPIELEPNQKWGLVDTNIDGVKVLLDLQDPGHTNLRDPNHRPQQLDLYFTDDAIKNSILS